MFDPHAPELDALVAYLKFRGNLDARPYRPGEWNDGVFVVKIVDEHTLSFPAYRGDGTRELRVWSRNALLHIHPPTARREPHTQASMYGSLRAYTRSFGRGRPTTQSAATGAFTAGDPFQAFQLAADDWFERALAAFEADGYSRACILKNIGQRGQLPYRLDARPSQPSSPAAQPAPEQLELLAP
jgi:hypothetical protein